MGNEISVRGGALGHFGDARRAASGDTLVERVVETGSLVIRKLGGTRAREITIHRFLSAPSVTCGEMVETLAHRTAAACKGHRIVAAQDTTEINFAGREERRRGLGPAGDGVRAGDKIPHGSGRVVRLSRCKNAAPGSRHYERFTLPIAITRCPHMNSLGARVEGG